LVHDFPRHGNDALERVIAEEGAAGDRA